MTVNDLIRGLENFSDKEREMDVFSKLDAHDKTVAQTLQNIKSVTTKIEIALASGDIE